jgi:hypothetical protein
VRGFCCTWFCTLAACCVLRVKTDVHGYITARRKEDPRGWSTNLKALVGVNKWHYCIVGLTNFSDEICFRDMNTMVKVCQSRHGPQSRVIKTVVPMLPRFLLLHWYSAYPNGEEFWFFQLSFSRLLDFYLYYLSIFKLLLLVFYVWFVI